MAFDFVTAGIELVKTVINKFPDPTQKAAAQLEVAKLEQSGELAKLAAETDMARIEADDRNSARQREIAIKDRMPGVLASGVTVGFFGVLGYMLVHGAPKEGGEALFIMLGSLGASWGGVINYYFGSSSGSEKKSQMMATMMNK